MINGIIRTDNGFAVKDFEAGKVAFDIGNRQFPSYQEAVEGCRGKFYPSSYHQYLIAAGKFKTTPDADVWENLIYAGDHRGVWDGIREEYRSVTSMDKGAATEDEIDYVDALASTYESLVAMVK